MELFRDSIAGQLVRYATSNRYLLFPEEENDFVFKSMEALDERKETPFIDLNIGLAPRQLDEEGAITPTSATAQTTDDEIHNLSDSGKVLVDWYSDTDPANPQNWSSLKKGFVLFQLCAYTMAIYGASSMFVPGEQGVSAVFKVGATPAALGLAMYVLGYGIGPLLFALLSEIPAVGRNWVYVPTFFLFVILSIPTAFVKNYAGLLVLRFITGFLGSPCLANGGNKLFGSVLKRMCGGKENSGDVE